ncbi:MAG TPA: MFS transporter [Pseudonocardiaceae bacterium]|jgi:MFS family permease|nr:MFS transporter [Pseudonocardiaceae bacterium]
MFDAISRSPEQQGRSAPGGSADTTTLSGHRAKGAMAAIFTAVFVANFAMVLPGALNGLIQLNLHASGAQLSWISAIFFIPTAALELTFGVIGDLVGRRRLLIIGALTLAVGTGIGALATTIGVLLVGQAIAGIGAAVLFPTSLASVAALTPDPRKRAKGIAMWTMAMAIGASTGPMVSGAIGLHASFHWAFAVAALLALFCAVISFVYMPDSRSPEGRGLDVAGQITFAVALTAILFGVIQGANIGYGSAPIIGCFVGGGALMVVFVVIELQARFSLIHTELFRSMTYSGAALIALVNAVGFFGFNYSVSLRVSVIQGQGSLVVGITSATQAVVPLVMWPILARLLYRIPPRWVIVWGLAFMAIAQFWVASIPIADTSIPALVPSLLLGGFGFVAVVSSTSASMVDVPIQKEGVASGTINMARDTGAAIGIAAIGAIALAHASSVLPGVLAKFGISGNALVAVNHVLAAGGPIAVAHANLGPISARSIPAAQSALWQGFSLAITFCGALSVVAIVIALCMIRSGALRRGLTEDHDLVSVEATGTSVATSQP